MSCTGSPFRRVSGILLCLALLSCSQAFSQCNLPITRTFGVNDAFNPNPDPRFLLSQFVTFLNNQGIPSGKQKSFDDATINRHMVASLRHGLRGCFPNATKLTLCFRARADAPGPSGAGNDGVIIYNTNFNNNTFPVIFSSAIVPSLSPTWTTGKKATLCINLTSKMPQIGDMLQFKLQDDTTVDFITMTLQ
jgi:hypothetical protein